MYPRLPTLLIRGVFYPNAPSRVLRLVWFNPRCVFLEEYICWSLFREFPPFRYLTAAFRYVHYRFSTFSDFFDLRGIVYIFAFSGYCPNAAFVF